MGAKFKEGAKIEQVHRADQGDLPKVISLGKERVEGIKPFSSAVATHRIGLEPHARFSPHVFPDVTVVSGGAPGLDGLTQEGSRLVAELPIVIPTLPFSP